jgi:hypothetical protein
MTRRMWLLAEVGIDAEFPDVPVPLFPSTQIDPDRQQAYLQFAEAAVSAYLEAATHDGS